MTDMNYERQGAYEKGREEGLREMARALLADGISVDLIMKYSGLAKEEIQAL